MASSSMSVPSLPRLAQPISGVFARLFGGKSRRDGRGRFTGGPGRVTATGAEEAAGSAARGGAGFGLSGAGATGDTTDAWAVGGGVGVRVRGVAGGGGGFSKATRGSVDALARCAIIRKTPWPSPKLV